MLFCANVNVSPSSVRPISRSPAVKPFAGGVFAEQQAAARRHGDVVGVVELVRVRRVVDQLQRLRARVVLEHLTLAGAAAVGREEVTGPIAPPAAFEPAEPGAALGRSPARTTSASRPPDRRSAPTRRPRSCRSDRTTPRSTFGWPPTFSMYSAPPRSRRPRRFGHELVEAAVVAGVLGLVDVAGRGSTIIASCEKRPMSTSGVGSPRLGADLEAPAVAGVVGFLAR